MNRFLRGLSGLLVMAISLFEFSEIKRMISLVAEGEAGYLYSLVRLCIYVIAIILAGVLIIKDKKKASAVCLMVAGGVALYNLFVYIGVIMGKYTIFGIVFGNVVDLLKIVLFGATLAVVMLSCGKVTERFIRGSFVSAVVALILAISGRVAPFISSGKSFIYDIDLFFTAYGVNILCTLVMFAAVAFYIWHLVPEKRKKRR